MTVEELLEIEEIKNLRHLYALYLDSGNIDKLVGLFVEDGVAEWPDFMGGHWAGRERMLEGWTAVFESHGMPFGHLHIATNPFIRLTGPDTANGRYYAISIHTTEKKLDQVINVIGIHDDLYRKIDGQWYFEKTRYDFLYPERLYTGLRIPI